LALVSAASGARPDFTLRIAVTLARTGMLHLGRSVQVADATKVPLAYLAQFMEEVRRCIKDGDLIIVALSTITDNPITVSIAQAVDTVLLCVLLEQMASSEAKKTVSQIGEKRFVGSAIFHGSGGLASATNPASG
jgi:Mrp family chromosome partitioning ATPase